MDQIAELREVLARPALVYEPASAHHSIAQTPSLFGAVTVASPQEEWPTFQGEALVPVLQLNLSELPFRPTGLTDVELLTLFVSFSESATDEENEESWCLRSYRDLSLLEPLAKPHANSGFEVIPLGLPRLVEDFPCYEELEEKVEAKLCQQFKERHPNQGGIKLGGWPSLIRSDILAGVFSQHPSRAQFVFQVQNFSERKPREGYAYFGHGTVPGMKDKWASQWQSFSISP